MQGLKKGGDLKDLEIVYGITILQFKCTRVFGGLRVAPMPSNSFCLAKDLRFGPPAPGLRKMTWRDASHFLHHLISHESQGIRGKLERRLKEHKKTWVSEMGLVVAQT